MRDKFRFTQGRLLSLKSGRGRGGRRGGGRVGGRVGDGGRMATAKREG